MSKGFCSSYFTQENESEPITQIYRIKDDTSNLKLMQLSHIDPQLAKPKPRLTQSLR